MSHDHGAHLGGIRTLADLMGRCVIDRDTACWHLRTARGKPMARDSVHRVWLFGAGVRSATRVAWELRHETQVPPGLVVSRACRSYDCVNPAHLRCWSKAEEGELLRRKGHHRGSVARKVANRANARCRSKLTPELAQWVRESPQTLVSAAHALDVAPSLVGNIRTGKAWRTDAGTSVFSWRPT